MLFSCLISVAHSALKNRLVTQCDFLFRVRALTTSHMEQVKCQKQLSFNNNHYLYRHCSTLPYHVKSPYFLSLCEYGLFVEPSGGGKQLPTSLVGLP